MVNDENDHIFFLFFYAEFYRVVWTINALLTVRSEMLPISENDQNIKMLGVPQHFAIGYVHNDNLPLGNICITICHSKQLQEGLMVFSNDSLHFLKIKKKIVEFTETILWL